MSKESERDNSRLSTVFRCAPWYRITWHVSLSHCHNYTSLKAITMEDRLSAASGMRTKERDKDAFDPLLLWFSSPVVLDDEREYPSGGLCDISGGTGATGEVRWAGLFEQLQPGRQWVVGRDRSR